MAKKTTVEVAPKGAGKKKSDAVPVLTKQISIRGARVHNLKNVSVDLPRNALICVTGPSGSGKSSLAFDTLYAEGQRRFVESLSAYARQFLARMSKPDVDQITGIPPAIAIEQKTISRNPRSTVGTTTEIYDYLRLLFGRVGKTRCVECGSVVRRDTPSSATEDVLSLDEGAKLYLLAPLTVHDDQTVQQEQESLLEKGLYRYVVADDKATVREMAQEPLTPAAVNAGVLLLIDRIIIRKGSDKEEELRSRISDSFETAFQEGRGRCEVFALDSKQSIAFSSLYECSACKIEYDEPDPRLFLFNSPHGACPECQGFGRAIGIDEDLVVPNQNLSLRQGAIHPFTLSSFAYQMDTLMLAASKEGIPLDVPYRMLTKQQREKIRKGWDGFVGIDGFFRFLEAPYHKVAHRVMASRYRSYTRCPECDGSRLRLSARRVFIGGKTIADVVGMTIGEAAEFFDTLILSPFDMQIADRILKEIRARLHVLVDVGIEYLTLDRLSHTLSGGESQRIHLATSIGSTLVGALYVLDEPSIGLHPRDTDKLIAVLKRLRNLGNTVVVVEHEEAVMRNSDMLIDMGPGAGEHGGSVVAVGTPSAVEAQKNSLTGKYLSGKLSIPLPKKRRKWAKKLLVKQPRENNLRSGDVEIPLGCFVAVTGVSGSGKSTLVNDILFANLARNAGEGVRNAGKCDGIEGLEHINGYEMVDQSPIGRSSRSTPATYTKAFDGIRDLFAQTQAAKQLDWKAGHFSFNVEGGRCATCEGEGVVTVEMQFMADIHLECEECQGTRYKKEAREILFNGKSIVDVLAMTITEAREFFAQYPKITERLQPLLDVGLGYMRLGQAGTTLSGGEAQRVKLASHLLEKDRNSSTFYIFDEPTTGLHFDDVAKLIASLQKLVDAGHSVLVVEHNLDVIKCVDWVIDLGPEAGDRGGLVVAAGTPEHLSAVEGSYTGRFLRPYLK